MAEIVIITASIIVTGLLTGYIGYGYGHERGAKLERKKVRRYLNKIERQTPASEKYDIKRAYGRH